MNEVINKIQTIAGKQRVRQASVLSPFLFIFLFQSG